MRVNDEGEKVRVLMKTKKEAIRELLFVCTGKEDCTLVQINGKFTKDDIDKLVNQETGKKHGLKDVIEGESGISSSVKAEVARYIEEE